MFRKILYIVCFSALCLGIAQAQPDTDPETLKHMAMSGDADAQLELGMLYEYGFFMQENRVPALSWYILAARQGSTRAMKQRDHLMSQMNQQEIDEAERQAAILLQGAPSMHTESITPDTTQPEQQPTENQPGSTNRPDNTGSPAS